jgi:hypothetical protein
MLVFDEVVLFMCDSRIEIVTSSSCCPRPNPPMSRRADVVVLWDDSVGVRFVAIEDTFESPQSSSGSKHEASTNGSKTVTSYKSFGGEKAGDEGMTPLVYGALMALSLVYSLVVPFGGTRVFKRRRGTKVR